MNRLNYSTMSLTEIHDDLLETVNDLYFNAGLAQLESILNDFECIDENSNVSPSDNLVCFMEELYGYDEDQLNSRALELMRCAVDEMLVLARR